MPVAWPDAVDEVIAGDAAAGVAYLTPAKGVVITPMSPLGVRDRERGTVTVSTSLGLWKKIARLRANPAAAIAYHAREHGYADRPDFVLVQGRAKVQPQPDREWLESITPHWERFLGPRTTGLTARLMRVYYWERVGIEIEIERVLWWRDGDCAGEPEVLGAPLPGPAAPQKPPKNGTGPREDCDKLISAAGRLPHTLLGWSGGDELPLLVTARATGSGPKGVSLAVANDLVPQGGRRAGLTSHAFERAMIGQEQRIHTGWLQRDGEALTYAPHTKAGARLPPSKLLFNVGAGIATRAGMRGARKAGVA